MFTIIVKKFELLHLTPKGRLVNLKYIIHKKLILKKKKSYMRLNRDLHTKHVSLKVFPEIFENWALENVYITCTLLWQT